MSEFRTAADKLNRVAPPGESLAYVNPAEQGVLKALGGSGKPAAGGVPSYKKGDVEAPPPRNYGQETRDTLEAQVQLAPYLAAAEMNPVYGRPAYARMEQNMLWDSLLGAQAPAQQAYATMPQMPSAGQAGTDPLVALGMKSGAGASYGASGGPGPAGYAGAPVQQRGGLLELYEKHIAPSLIRQQRQAAEGEIGMLRELGPEFLQAQRAADPTSERIRRGLQTKAIEGLEAGQGLTQEELAGITESVRSGQAARGEAFQRSQPAMIQETMARLGAGRQAESQRIARAASILGQTGQVDPFMALTGRTARIPGQVAQQMGTSGFALQAGPQLFSPESAYAGALAGSNQANIMNARMASAANKSAIMGGVLGGLGSMAGGHFMGAAMKGS